MDKTPRIVAHAINGCGRRLTVCRLVCPRSHLVSPIETNLKDYARPPSHLPGSRQRGAPTGAGYAHALIRRVRPASLHLHFLQASVRRPGCRTLRCTTRDHSTSLSPGIHCLSCWRVRLCGPFLTALVQSSRSKILISLQSLRRDTRFLHCPFSTWRRRDLCEEHFCSAPSSRASFSRPRAARPFDTTYQVNCRVAKRTRINRSSIINHRRCLRRPIRHPTSRRSFALRYQMSSIQF
jgi:hypothetical protein